MGLPAVILRPTRRKLLKAGAVLLTAPAIIRPASAWWQSVAQQSVGSTWTPANLTGLIGWYKADTGVTAPGGNVTAVVNQANPGTNDLVNQGTVPLNATGLNGKPAFDFLAANGAALTSTNFPLGTGTTGSMFIVLQMKTATATFGGALVYGVGGNNDFGSTPNAAWLTRDGTNNNVETFRGNNLLAIQAISLATTYRIGSIFDGANNTVYLNNVAGTPVACSDAWGTNGTLVLGNRYLAGVVGGGAWEGPEAEIVVTTSALTLTERNNLDAYFVGRGF